MVKGMAKKIVTKEEFIQEIKDWMHKNKTNQVKLARLLGISPSSLCETLANRDNNKPMPKRILDHFGREHKVVVKQSYPLVEK